LEQARGWLTGVGFVIEREYADYNRSLVNNDSTRAIIFARKY
jgi:hypothetical protein